MHRIPQSYLYAIQGRPLARCRSPGGSHCVSYPGRRTLQAVSNCEVPGPQPMSDCRLTQRPPGEPPGALLLWLNTGQ